MKCCAIGRAISCSTIWVCAKTRRGSSFAPTAPTFHTSCARISPSRWGCRSDTRSARAAAAASRRNVPQWWNIQNEEPPPAPPEQKPRPAAACSGCSTSQSRLPRREFRRDRKGSCRVSDIIWGRPSPTASSPETGERRASDDNTDYYPVPLKQETLRPGTVYADPYGHVLVLARRLPQSDDAAGVLLAVDAQPDGTVARKRFWRGNFLFAQDPALGSPGFKRFRPIVREERRLAAADQRRNREKSAVRRFFARAVAARGRRLLRSHG